MYQLTMFHHFAKGTETKLLFLFLLLIIVINDVCKSLFRAWLSPCISAFSVYFIRLLTVYYYYRIALYF